MQSEKRIPDEKKIPFENLQTKSRSRIEKKKSRSRIYKKKSRSRIQKKIPVEKSNHLTFGQFDNDFVCLEIEPKYHQRIVVLLSKVHILGLQDIILWSMFPYCYLLKCKPRIKLILSRNSNKISCKSKVYFVLCLHKVRSYIPLSYSAVLMTLNTVTNQKAHSI